ncbi:hypothetical protein ABIF63_000032 [Bradyrhizobium japonicum]|uniref:Uncharacterized protein n=1 Tax=Bradyrhizobium japonicum TaxID=375 RepID=A0ABV2RI58_BRAJP
MLDFVRLTGLFCEPEGEADALKSCWERIPVDLEDLRKSAEALYARAASAEGEGADTASSVARVEGERAVIAIAALGQSWGWQQSQPGSTPQTAAPLRLGKCGENGANRTVPKELVDAIHQMAEIKVYAKLQRAKGYFPELREAIEELHEVLAADKPTAEQMDTFCRFSSAVDSRTNTRLADFIANPEKAGAAKDKAQLLQNHHKRACAEGLAADRQGFCSIAPGEHAISFSDYLRGSFRSWNKANTLVKDKLPEVLGSVADRLTQDRAALAVVQNKKIQLSVVVANLIAGRIPPIEPKKDAPVGVASSEARSQFGLLLTRLEAKTSEENRPKQNAGCAVLNVKSAIHNVDRLVEELKALMEKAGDTEKGATKQQLFADFAKNARAWLSEAISNDDLAAIKTATEQLAKLEDHLTIAKLSDSGAGLALEADLQRACAHDGKIEIEMAFRLAPKSAGSVKAQREAVVGVALAVQLRRSILVSMEVSEFRSGLLGGTLENTLSNLAKENLPKDFAADLSELCALPAALGSSPEARRCAWPAALQLPTRARVVFDADLTAVAIALPDWLGAVLPDQCPRSITIGQSGDIASLLTCFGGELKKHEPALRAMLGQRFLQLQADAQAKIDAQFSAPLIRLIGEQHSKSDTCKPTVSVALTDDSGALDAIRRSVMVTNYHVLDKDRKDAALPSRVSVLKLHASLAVDNCLRSNQTLPQRLLGIWRGTTLTWSRTLEVTLPRAVENGAGAGSSDPLDAWFDGLSAFARNAETMLFVWDDPLSNPIDLDRNIAASLLLLSNHLELCKAPDGQGEELNFHFSAISNNGGFMSEPCTATDSAQPLVLARGVNFRSLLPSRELENVAIGPITGTLKSSVALHLKDLLDFGSMPDLSDDAKSCSNVLSANRLSFDIDSGTIGTSAIEKLPRLHLIVGWETGKSASLALLSDPPNTITPIERVIASIAHLPANDIKVIGFAVDGGDVKPCVKTASTVTRLAAKLGSTFVAELLSSDATSKLGEASRDLTHLGTLVTFIRDSQPRNEEYERARKASDLLLRLRSCAGGKEGGNYLTCDYVIAIEGCQLQLRIDATDFSATKLRFDGSRLAIPAGCAPTALSTLFGSDTTADLPFTLSEPVLEIGDTIEFGAQLVRPPTSLNSAAVHSCLDQLSAGQQAIHFKVNSSRSASIDRSAVDRLTDCAKKYAISKAADAILPPMANLQELASRVNETIWTWVDDTNAAMKKACDSLTTGPLNCKGITIGQAAKMFPSDLLRASNEICTIVAAPIDSALQTGKKVFKAKEQCIHLLSGEICAQKPSDPICSAHLIGFQFEANIDLPGVQKVSAKAHFLPPNNFKVDSCFQGIDSKAPRSGYLQVKVEANCKDELLGLSGTISFANDLLSDQTGKQFSISAPISLRVNLKTASVSIDIKAPKWTAILNDEFSRALTGRKLLVSGNGIEVAKAEVDDNGIATINGTVILDLGENHVQVPGFKLTIDLLRGTFKADPFDARAAMSGLFSRQFGQMLSIPGVLTVVPEDPVFDRSGNFKSVSATATVEAELFAATLPRITFDQTGVHINDPVSIGLAFNAEIPIPPLSLTRISGTISQKFLSLGAEATFGQKTMAYLVKATGKFTLPFDLAHEDITANEQMVVFTVIPLGKSTSVINVGKPLLSRTIEIGGPLKPIIWLHGQAELDKSKLSGDTEFSLFGVNLSRNKLNADIGSGSVSASGNANIGIGKLDYAFNSKQFVRDARLGMNGAIGIGGFNLSEFKILATVSSAAVKFRVLGISLGLVSPGLKDINSDMLLKLLGKLFSFDLKDLGKALEAILSGNLTINPFSHFGKDQGNGIASSDGNGSEGEPGSENGGGETGGIPGAAADAAKQTPSGEGNKKDHDEADSNVKQKTEELKQDAKGASPGASKPLLNRDGNKVMQFALRANGAEPTIVGDFVEAGHDSVTPLLVLKQGSEPKFFFSTTNDPTHLGIVPAPVLLASDLLVASEASKALFLPGPPESRNQDDNPIKGLCATGAISEVDLLLFPGNRDADTPKRLPAGLLGLCLEGLENLGKNEAANDLLEAGLRVASIGLPNWSPGNPKDRDKIEGPMRSAWFQCDDPGKGKISGLGMLFTGELASRVILRKQDATISYFRMSGFPYGAGDDELKERQAACLLLANTKPTRDDQPFDFITLNETNSNRIAGRTPSGDELKFDGSKWVQIDTDDTQGVPPLILPISPRQDEHDHQIRQAIQGQNEGRRSNSQEKVANPSRAYAPGGRFLCVIQNGGVPSLAEKDNRDKPFLNLEHSEFVFERGAKKTDFPLVAQESEDCSLSGDPAQLVIYNPWKTPSIGRVMAHQNDCALDLFWREGTVPHHKGFELTASLCASVQTQTANRGIFDHDMYWVFEPFMSCLNRLADRDKCIPMPEPTMVGGGWSNTNRVVIAPALPGQGVFVWADRIQFQSKRGLRLQGSQEALNNLIRREWKPAAIDAFTEWFQHNPTDLRLIHSKDQEMSFMGASTGQSTTSVLRINFGVAQGKEGAKTAIDFISVPGVLSEETIVSVLDQSGVIPATPNRTEVALISNKDGLTFAVKQAPKNDQETRWDLYKNNTRLKAVLLGGLTSEDMVLGLAAALDRLANMSGEIRIAHNSNALLLTNGEDAFVADRATGSCVEPLLRAGTEDAIRKPIIDLWVRDFASSQIKLATCAGAVIDIKPRLVSVDGQAFKIVDYPAGVLDRLVASHVLANGRSMTVLRQAGTSASFGEAENQAIAYGLGQKSDRLDLLGQIGEDRLRFKSGQKAGLAGPLFACPFADSEKLSQPSVVLNEYLASIDKQCKEGKVDFGKDIHVQPIVTSDGTFDIVAGPVPDSNAVWSVFFGDGKGDSAKIQSARVTFDESVRDTEYFDDLLALARAWVEGHSRVGRGLSVKLTQYGGDGGVVVAIAGGQAFAATTSGAAARHFWQLGGSEPIADPFVALDQTKIPVAVGRLKADLELLSASQATNSKRAGSFCVLQSKGATLWPSLLEEVTPLPDETQLFEQRYQSLGSERALIVVASDAPSCQSLQDEIQEVYRDELRLVAFVAPHNGRSREVWLGEDALSGGRSLTRRDPAPCLFRSRADQTEIFRALRDRPQALDCPASLFKTILTEANGATSRLVLTDRGSGDVTTAWVEDAGDFKAIGLIGSVQNYTEDHWRLLRESDLSRDVSRMAVTLPWRNENAEALIVAPLGDKIFSRSVDRRDCEAGACKVRVRTVETLGFSRNSENCAVQSALKLLPSEQNCAVLAALKEWASRKDDPAGLVFLPGTKARFWILNNARSADLFKLGSKRTYNVAIEANSLDTNALMHALYKANEAVVDAIEDGKDFPSTLRIKESMVLIGKTRLVLQMLGGDVPVHIATYDKEPEHSLTDSVIAALARDPMRCIEMDPCLLLTRQRNFALVGSAKATLGSADSESFGQASIFGREAHITALIDRLLEVANKSQLAIGAGIIVPMGSGQGLLADAQARWALFFDANASRQITLRPALSSLDSNKLAQGFIEQERSDFVARLVALRDEPSLGLSNHRDWFACSERSLTMFDHGRIGSVTAVGESIEPFCAAIEKNSFELNEGDGSLLMQRMDKYLLFKAVPGGNVKLRIWAPSLTGREAVELPFDPANISKPSLENDILTAAVACEDVLVVAREGTGFALVRKLTPQRKCSIAFEGESGKTTTTDIDQSTFFIKREVHGAAPIVAGADLPTETIAPRLSEILREIERRATAKSSDGNPIRVRARQDLPSILETKNAVLEANDGTAPKRSKIIGWLPQQDGPVQTITGSGPEIDLLWESLGSRIPKLSGTTLRLDAFIKAAGAVLSDDANHSITVAPDSADPGSVTRDRDAVVNAIKDTCSKIATFDKCSRISPIDVAKAALKGTKGPDGGRRIAYDERNSIIWPENAWTFWNNIGHLPQAQ